MTADKIYYRCCTDDNGRTAFFIVNTSRERSFDIKIKININRIPTVIDTVSGDCIKAYGRLTNNGFECEMHIKIGGSVMFISKPLKKSVTLQSGAEFKNKYSCLKFLSYPKCKIKDVNVLPLDTVDYKVDGITLLQKPVESLWYKNFYNLKDGTPFEATYRFNVSYVPSDSVYAMIEMAQNLDSVCVNRFGIL